VRDYDRVGIIAEFKKRTDHDLEAERKQSLQKICKIARFGLEDLKGAIPA
jgi:2-oxo-4-hydroxy-4-carboxy-5-ureidoimidazoline decarboxylase